VHVPSVTHNERLQYEVRLDAELDRIDVQLCPSGFRIARLNSPSPGAERLLEGGNLVTPQGDVPVAPDSEGVDLPSTAADECLSYALHLPEKTPDPTSLRRVGRDRLASPDLWLWVPTPRPEGVQIRVHVQLPEGVTAALPWPLADSGTAFSVPETAFSWKAGGAFTHGALETLSAPGGSELRWAVLGEGFEHPADVRRWIAEGAQSASVLFGRFPVPRALLIAVPTDRPGPAFGMALRGGGPAVTVFLNRRASAATLQGDWTCSHEFLHLGVPRLPPEDAWLFEGLATYYTEVTRARSGLISPEQAYQHLLEGFERGRKDGGSLTLREESASMRERRSFYRVYWAGAALALLTDLSTRRAGGPTLDSALRSFAECCASSEEEWNAERVLAHLDATLGAPLFSDQARRWLDRAEFPDLSDALRALGVAPGKQGRAVFGRAPAAALRDAIMARTATP
jgi:M61 glycyl aminopeptidase